jgi:hypothetical protein
MHYEVTVKVTLLFETDTPSEAVHEAKDYLHRRLMPMLQTEPEPYMRLDWEHSTVEIADRLERDALAAAPAPEGG